MNIKKWFSKVRILKRLKESAILIARFREENNTLKGQLMKKRKKIKELTTISDEITKRRDEFIKRIKSIPDASITNFSDYKFFLSEPFIVESYEPYIVDKDAIDGMSAVKGLGKLIKKIDKDDFILP